MIDFLKCSYQEMPNYTNECFHDLFDVCFYVQITKCTHRLFYYSTEPNGDRDLKTRPNALVQKPSADRTVCNIATWDSPQVPWLRKCIKYLCVHSDPIYNCLTAFARLMRSTLWRPNGILKPQGMHLHSQHKYRKATTITWIMIV